MAAPKYMVTSEPGTYVAGIGFIKPGEVYSAPPGHVPSRTALPINGEAAAELKKVKALLDSEAKEQRSIADDQRLDQDERKAARFRARTLEAHSKAVRTEPVVFHREEPAIEEGMTLAELDSIKGADQAPGEKSSKTPKL